MARRPARRANAAPAVEVHIEQPGPTEFTDPFVRRELARASVWLGLALAIIGVIVLAQPLMLIIGGMIFAFFRLKRTERGRQLWDRFKLRIPMRVGDVVHKIALARFSRTLSTLVSSGVDIIKALEITGQTSGNWVVEDALAGVRAKVHEGVPIAQPLVENEVFPPMVSQMVKIGEETGELDRMLSKVADFYEDEVDTSIQSLTSIIEPILMIGVGFMVGTIVIAMYLPMFRMLSLVK